MEKKAVRKNREDITSRDDNSFEHMEEYDILHSDLNKGS